jgi:hypothetical protein
MKTEILNTGGNCTAICITLDDGRELFITNGDASAYGISGSSFYVAMYANRAALENDEYLDAVDSPINGGANLDLRGALEFLVGVDLARRVAPLALNPDCADLLAEIDMLQQLQRNHAPDSVEWRFASRKLAPLFLEMARRVNRG